MLPLLQELAAPAERGWRWESAQGAGRKVEGRAIFLCGLVSLNFPDSAAEAHPEEIGSF